MKTFTTKLIVAVFLFAILAACGKEEKKTVQEPVAVETKAPEPVAEPELIADEPEEPAPKAVEPKKADPKAKTAEASKPEPEAKPEPAAPASEPKPEPKAAEKANNPFLGKWIARDGKDNKCILDFRDGGVLVVEQYETYGDGKVTCSGRGTYSVGSNKLGFDFKLENSDKGSKKKCGTNGRAGNQTYKLVGADSFSLTGNESDGNALLRSWFHGSGKVSSSDYYKNFTKIK